MNNVYTTCLVGYGHEPHDESKVAQFDGLCGYANRFFSHVTGSEEG